MALLNVIMGASLAVAANACPTEMTQTAQQFYQRYLQHDLAAQPLPLETVIRKNRAVFAPSLYQDLLAASMRNPGGGRAYLDFDPFFRNQVKTFSVSPAGCRMIAPDRGMVEMTQLSGLSRDRASTSCLRVEMVKQEGTWRIKDVLTPSEPDDQASTAAGRCAPNAAYSRLTPTLRLILAN